LAGFSADFAPLSAALGAAGFFAPATFLAGAFALAPDFDLLEPLLEVRFAAMFWSQG
jgi:hypothetical protein